VGKTVPLRSRSRSRPSYRTWLETGGRCCGRSFLDVDKPCHVWRLYPLAGSDPSSTSVVSPSYTLYHRSGAACHCLLCFWIRVAPGRLDACLHFRLGQQPFRCESGSYCTGERVILATITRSPTHQQLSSEQTYTSLPPPDSQNLDSGSLCIDLTTNRRTPQNRRNAPERHKSWTPFEIVPVSQQRRSSLLQPPSVLPLILLPSKDNK
jgi:hypothetical protein